MFDRVLDKLEACGVIGCCNTLFQKCKPKKPGYQPIGNQDSSCSCFGLFSKTDSGPNANGPKREEMSEKRRSTAGRTDYGSVNSGSARHSQGGRFG